jgi:hypothetical protein
MTDRQTDTQTNKLVYTSIIETVASIISPDGNIALRVLITVSTGCLIMKRSLPAAFLRIFWQRLENTHLWQEILRRPRSSKNMKRRMHGESPMFNTDLQNKLIFCNFRSLLSSSRAVAETAGAGAADVAAAVDTLHSTESSTTTSKSRAGPTAAAPPAATPSGTSSTDVFLNS